MAEIIRVTLMLHFAETQLYNERVLQAHVIVLR